METYCGRVQKELAAGLAVVGQDVAVSARAHQKVMLFPMGVLSPDLSNGNVRDQEEALDLKRDVVKDFSEHEVATRVGRSRRQAVQGYLAMTHTSGVGAGKNTDCCGQGLII